MNRRILASLLVIGMVGTVVSVGTTLAEFTDTESSQGNTFASGALDLKIDWEESYNGEQIESVSLTDNPSAIFNLTDVKPGDYGEATLSLHVFDNPAYLNMSVNQTSNEEVSCTEPESEAEGGDCGTEGELGQYLEFTIWYDDGDNVLEDEEQVIFNGTAEELEEAGVPEGVALDADPTTEERDAYENSTTRYIGFSWRLPYSVGNEVQTDSKTFDISFVATQERHTGNQTNGDNGNGEPQEEPIFYQADLTRGPVINDLSQETYNSRGDMAAWMHGGPGVPVDNESVADHPENCVDAGDDESAVWTVDTAADTATAEFNVTEDECEVTLVSYAKPFAGWIADRADEQVVFDSNTTMLNTGSHTMTVDIPNVN